MTEHGEAFDKKVREDRDRRRRHIRSIKGEVVMSDAFKKIASYGPAVTTYLQIIFKQPLPPNAKERKRLEKLRLWPRPPEEFSFPLREAPYHGLTQKGLAEGLRRLHEVGIIDRTHPGSAMRKGDFARYILSERWRDWGKPSFRVIPWQKAESPIERDETGKFKRRRGRKVLVAAISAATERYLTAESAATHPAVAAKSAVNRGGNEAFVAADSAAILYLHQSIQKKPGNGSSVTEEGKDVNRARARKKNAQASNGKPKTLSRSELLKGTTKVLEQLPDHPRVRDRRFAEFIAGQLEEVQRARLDSGKVRRAFEDREFLPDFVVNDLFSLIGIAGSGNGDFACGPWAEDEPLTMTYDGGEEATP